MICPVCKQETSSLVRNCDKCGAKLEKDVVHSWYREGIKFKKNKFSRKAIKLPNLCIMCANKNVYKIMFNTYHFKYPKTISWFWFGGLGIVVQAFLRMFYHPRIKVEFKYCEEHWKPEKSKKLKRRIKLLLVSILFLFICIICIYGVIWLAQNSATSDTNLNAINILLCILGAAIGLGVSIGLLISAFRYFPDYFKIDLELLGFLSKYYNVIFSFKNQEITDEFKKMSKEDLVQ